MFVQRFRPNIFVSCTSLALGFLATLTALAQTDTYPPPQYGASPTYSPNPVPGQPVGPGTYSPPLAGYGGYPGNPPPPQAPAFGGYPPSAPPPGYSGQPGASHQYGSVQNPRMQTPQSPPGQQIDPQRLDQMAQWERQDMGVPPSPQLHTGAFHGPTPNQIPGGQVITTKGLVPLLQGAAGIRPVVVDVLGSGVQLPNAISATFAAQAGTFRDQTQQQFAQLLQQATQGNLSVPVVFYCQGIQCWMSYNAALRAIKLGYTNVLWYRGGLEAWQQLGMPVVSQSQRQTGQMPPPQPNTGQYGFGAPPPPPGYAPARF